MVDSAAEIVETVHTSLASVVLKKTVITVKTTDIKTYQYAAALRTTAASVVVNAPVRPFAVTRMQRYFCKEISDCFVLKHKVITLLLSSRHALIRFELTRLHRISVGPIVLGELEEGCCRELSRREVEALYKRCLPEDPLCPTVTEVEATLARRLKKTVFRARKAVDLRASKQDNGAVYTAGEDNIGKTWRGGGAGGEHAVADTDCLVDQSKYAERCQEVEHADAEGFTRILRLLIDFARRDLHETPKDSQRESGNQHVCVCSGEEESLARARAVPPNVSHMTCGYRSSQIERLGLKYNMM